MLGHEGGGTQEDGKNNQAMSAQEDPEDYVAALEQAGSSTGAMDALLAELRGNVQAGSVNAKLDKFWPFFADNDPEAETRATLPFRQKFCTQAAQVLLPWFIGSQKASEAIHGMIRLLASSQVNFDQPAFAEPLRACETWVRSVPDISPVGEGLLSDLEAAIAGARGRAVSAKQPLLVAICQRVAAATEQSESEAFCVALAGHGFDVDLLSDECAERALRAIALQKDDKDLARALGQLQRVPEWLVAEDEHCRSLPRIIAWLLDAQPAEKGRSAGLVFNRIGLATEAFLAIPGALQWTQPWASRAIGPSAPHAGKAAALSLVLAAQQHADKQGEGAVSRFLSTLASGGFFKLVHNLLAQHQCLPARTRQGPTVRVIPETECDEENGADQGDNENDDDDDDDVPGLCSPEPKTSFAIAVPDLSLKSHFKHVNAAAVPKNSRFIDNVDRVLEIAREYACAAGTQARESDAEAGPTSFADQFGDLDSSDDENDSVVNENEGGSRHVSESAVRFSVRGGDSAATKVLSLQHRTGIPMQVAERSVAQIEWKVFGELPGTALLGASETVLVSEASRVALKEFADSLQVDYLWAIFANSLHHESAANEDRAIALLAKAGERVHADAAICLHEQAYCLAMSLWTSARHGQLRAVIEHFFSTAWTQPEVSWDWELSEETRGAHQHPFTMSSADDAYRAAIQRLAERATPRELASLVGHANGAVLLQLGAGPEASIRAGSEPPDSDEAKLGWLATFAWRHAHLRRHGSEADVQGHLRALEQMIVAGRKISPGLQLGAMVVLHELIATFDDGKLYASLDASVVEALVQAIANGREKVQLAVAAAMVLERAGRFRAHDGSLGALLSASQVRALGEATQVAPNAWLHAVCSTILWASASAEAEASVVVQSGWWQWLLADPHRAPDLARTRALRAAALNSPGVESLLSQMTVHEDLVYSALESTGKAETVLRYFDEPRARAADLAALAWSPTLAPASRAPVLTALSSELSRQPQIGLDILVAFSSAQRVNREFIRAHMDVLVSTLEDVAQRGDAAEPAWVAAAASALLPLAASNLDVDAPQESFVALLDLAIQQQSGGPRKSRRRVLDLSNGNLSGSNLVCLEAALSGRNIEEVNLSRNPEIGDKGAISVASWLTSAGSSIRALRLAGCGVGVQGFKSLADALRCTTQLEHLDLAGNVLTDESQDVTGLIALAESLIWNTTLRSLDLSGNALTQEGLSTLTRALRYNGALHSLRLEGVAASPLQLGAVYEKLELNRTGATASPHLGRGMLKKLPRLAREKARQTARILSGPEQAHLPYDRTRCVSSANPETQESSKSVLECFIKGSVQPRASSRSEDDGALGVEEEKHVVDSPADELDTIMRRINELKARQEALFDAPAKAVNAEVPQC